MQRTWLLLIPFAFVSSTVSAQEKPNPADSAPDEPPDAHDLSKLLVKSPPEPAPTKKNRITPIPPQESWESRPGPTLTGSSMWGPALKERTSRWYGWQTLVPVVSAQIFLVGAYVESDYDALRAALFVSPTIHLFAGPIVHWAHGNFQKGALAFAMNLTFPLTTLGIQTLNLMYFNSSPAGEIAYFTVGASFLAAEVLDMVLLSSETVYGPQKSTTGRGWLPSSLGLLPRFDSTQRGLVLVGQF